MPSTAAPRRLDLKVGFSCNNRCVFCVQGDKRARHADRSTEEVVTLLAAHRPECEAVVLTGGEATVRDDLVTLVARARELGYRQVQLQTNGRRLAYRPFVAALVKAGVTQIMAAVHGPSDAVHDALTGAGGAFRQTVDGIINARAAGLPVLTNTVVVQANYRLLPAIADLLIALDVRVAQLAFVHPGGTAGERFEEVVPRLTDAAPFIHQALDRLRGAGRRAYAEAMPWCHMRGYEEHILERHVPDSTVVDATWTLDSYAAHRRDEGKAHGRRCPQCAVADRCEGPWKEYVERYGDDELVPRGG